jgi:GT2 family glycosyltransferase
VYGSRNIELLKDNLSLAGYDFDVEEINISPLPSALNYGLKQSINYDAIMFLANDIKEPDNWLRLRAEDLKDNTGIVSIYPGELPVPTDWDLVGNYLISSKLIEAIGFFTHSFGDYGPIDLDYCHRARAAGFILKYVPNIKANHYDWNNDTAYGYSKNELVSKSWQQHCEDVSAYSSGIKSFKIDAA